GGAHDITVSDCLFRNAYYGLSSFGTTEVTIENNEFYNQSIQSLSLSVSHALVQGNHVENEESAIAYSIGLELWSSSDFVVNQNTVKLNNGAKGMQFQSSSISDSTINMVSNNYLQLSNTTNSMVGVNFDLATKLDFVHNSVRMSSLLSVAAFTGGSDVSLYNNILMNYGEGSVYSAILSVFHDADYNVIYSEGILSTLGATLAVHQSSGLDQNSTNFNLEFPQDGLPNICHYSVSNTGKALDHPVFTDYNNIDRTPATPDIGAYEFDLPTTAIFTPDTLFICLGDIISVTPENTFVSYLWLNDSSVEDSRDAFEDDQFFIQVVDEEACTLLDSLAVEVQSVEIDLGEDQVICQGAPVTLVAEEGLATYSWSTGASAESILVEEAGTYSIEVSNELGCTASDEVIVTLSDDVIQPNFLVSGIGCTSDTVQFIEVSDLEPDAVLWSFGDGNTSDEQHPAHLFGAVGDYMVNMTATLGECSMDVEKEIVITSTCSDYLVAYYPLDTAANDISDNLFEGTIAGGVSFVDDDERGEVAFFDGTSGYITLTTSQALDLVNESFTVSTWVKFTDASTTLPIIGTSVEDDNQGLNLGIEAGSAHMSFFNNDLEGVQSIASDEWHFVSYVYDADAATMTIYVDGERDATISDKGAFEGLDEVTIGLAQSEYFTGYLDDFRIWKEALTEDEVFENYSGHSAELMAYYPLTATTFDTSGNGFHGTAEGDVTFVEDTERGFVSSFDGSGDYIQLAQADDMGMSDNSFTVSAWVKLPSIDSDNSILGTYVSNGLLLFVRSNAKVRFKFDGIQKTTSQTLEAQEWYHLRFTYLKEDGTREIYINGQLAALESGIAAWISEDLVDIGRSNNQASKDMEGFISDLKIRKINDESTEGRIEVKEEESEIVSEMSLFPNPTEGLVNLVLTNEGDFEGKLAVFDIYGHQVWNEQINGISGRQAQIDLTGLESGLYIFRFVTHEHQYVKRLILK
ncbi:LamG-like jellyroll fold domain-containing protein, partial [Reichenbachiella sp.]